MAGAEAGESGESGSSKSGGAGDAFDRDVAQFLHEYFEAEPVGATFYGVTDWDAQLPDFTADGFARREAAAWRWLEHFSATSPGSADAAATGSGGSDAPAGPTAAL